MRRLLKIPLAGAVIAIARMLIRRLLDGGERAPSRSGMSAGPGGAAAASHPGGRPRADSSRTREDLYEEAKRLDVKGRSKMNKRQLEKAVEEARIGGRP
jgi:hypothetical protein